MSDHETTVLGRRLSDLADELAPSIDVLSQIDGARVRYRRDRRARIAVVSVAAALAMAAVAVPTAIGSFAGPSSGEVAGPSPTTTATASEHPADTRSAVEEARDAVIGAHRVADDRLAAEEAARQAAEAAARQAARARVIADALADRDPPLELRDGGGRDCPDEAARLTGALGAEVRTDGGVDLVGGCRWSGATVTLELSFVPGLTEEEMVREVGRSVSRDGCHVQAMPSTVDVTPLTVCPVGAGTTWTLRVPDSTGAGYWVLSAEEVAGATTDAGAGGLLALVDAAAARW